MAKYINFIFDKIKNFFLILFIIKDYFLFKKAARKISRFPVRTRDLYPCVLDKTPKTSFDRHYVFHTAWAARKVKEINPKTHIDISSSLYFSSIVSAFVPVKFYDYRPANLNLSELSSERADLLSLPFPDGSIKSLSCMHTVEHVGLGRYGDPINPDADIKAIKELKRVLAKGGSLLFVVPLGRPRIQFNAHRIYSYDQILSYFPDLKLKEFAFIPQYEKDGGIKYNPPKELVSKEKYACGCFWFIK